MATTGSHPTLSADDRSKIRQAIIDKGLIPGQQAFTSGAWWTKATNNWSQVCNGGLLSGAVAIADESPDLAGSIIESSKISLQKGMSMFSPDGAGLEGLTYWNYGLRYNIYYLEGATTALGTDFGLSQLPGFSVTGHYRLHMVSPIKKSFSYSDQNADVFGAGGVVLWLARKFNQPLYARFEYDNFGLGGVESLLWYEPSLINSTNVLPTAAYFREAEVVAMRSDWKIRMPGTQASKTEITRLIMAIWI